MKVLSGNHWRMYFGAVCQQARGICDYHSPLAAHAPGLGLSFPNMLVPQWSVLLQVFGLLEMHEQLEQALPVLRPVLGGTATRNFMQVRF